MTFWTFRLKGTRHLQIIHIATSVLVGAALTGALGAGVATRDAGPKSAAAAFLPFSLGIGGFALGQLLRMDAMTLGQMDAALRVSQCSVFIATAALPELFRRVTGAPK